MRFKTLGICIPILFLAFQSKANTIIAYDLTSLGAGEYQYNYSVSNDGSLGANVPIQLFDIFFNPALYQAGSLQIVTPDPPSSDWSEVILASVGTNPADYDAFALSSGIAVGDRVSGFAVRFQWIGAGNPGAQPFSISDPNTFDVLQNGATTPAPAPEPSTFLTIAMISIATMLASFLRRFRGVNALAFRR